MDTSFTQSQMELSKFLGDNSVPESPERKKETKYSLERNQMTYIVHSHFKNTQRRLKKKLKVKSGLQQDTLHAVRRNISCPVKNIDVTRKTNTSLEELLEKY